MRWLLLLLVAACLAAVQDPTVVTTPAHNLPWNAPTDEPGMGPIIGLAHTAERYREHLVPLHDPPAAAPDLAGLPLATHDLLLVSWGVKPSGGYRLAATAVIAEDDQSTVILRCDAPDPDAMVTMALTHPAVLVPIPKRQELVIRLTGDRPPVGVTDFAPSTGSGFTIIDDRPQP